MENHFEYHLYWQENRDQWQKKKDKWKPYGTTLWIWIISNFSHLWLRKFVMATKGILNLRSFGINYKLPNNIILSDVSTKKLMLVETPLSRTLKCFFEKASPNQNTNQCLPEEWGWKVNWIWRHMTHSFLRLGIGWLGRLNIIGNSFKRFFRRRIFGGSWNLAKKIGFWNTEQIHIIHN